MNKVNLKLYAVRNQEGKWFRAKGYGGYGSSWVDDIESAKIYAKPSGARGRVTWWATNYPKYGIPELVELTVTKAVALDETDRVKGVKRQKEVAQANWEARQSKHKLEQAQRDLKRAEAQLKKLQQ